MGYTCWYLYLETSNTELGQRARLVSPTFRGFIGQSCYLRFYFHMFGEDIGQLNVYTRSEENGPLVLLWNRQGNHGDFFQRADISLSSPLDFQIIIEATSGGGIYGDIAIDDTSFSPGCEITTDPLPVVATDPPTPPSDATPTCPPDSYQCRNGSCIDALQRCDMVRDCSEGEDEENCGKCTFETVVVGDTCGWQSIPNGLYLWEKTRAADVPSGRGPAIDHTLQNSQGYYMFVDSTFGTFGVTALLVSPFDLPSTGSL
ncbi:MAM and LDL-receptor class A domain-containing protein 1-like [Diadema setosum]|uniref:MAM and LDL-receptor class A domain-containing protein 1-like n=1 Tax=Diadema setosum TaxID=31175 RepID=UPI003B3BBD53